MYEDSNATKDRRVGCLDIFWRRRMLIMTEHGRSGKGNEIKQQRGRRRATTHAAFHLWDISGKREEPSQRRVILRLDRHTCSSEDTQQAITIRFAYQ
ncbi:uncharacterized protein N7479_003326 [Penicillium vulpinum]|uniref:uncharacterized protein n=1 Tax=Penicillium vulpinum TaxID=29845 RepID=UPI002547DBE3|nr:uncharacterized protein N7479_003326 [Penicillium vulpinum]KAJ5963450.1 hypothetical protein N7479_003326 [Penicillium vulpinum]